MDRLHTSKRECLEAKNLQGQRVGISDNDIRKRKLPGRRVYCALPVCAFQIKTSCQPSMTTFCMAHDCTDHCRHHIKRMRFRTLPWLGCSVDSRPGEVVNTSNFSTLLDTKTSVERKMRWHLIQVKRSFCFSTGNFL